MTSSNAPLPSRGTLPKRRKQFERPEAAPNTEVTARDLDILEQVARHRFLSSEQIAGLVSGTRKKVAERCGQLFAAGLLDKPRRQLEYFVLGGGSRPHIYALSNAGAVLLVEARRAQDIEDLDWKRKNHRAGRHFILHTLAVADFAIGLTRSVDLHPGYKLLLHDELTASLPAETQAREKPWAWGPAILPPHYAAARGSAGITNVPDLAAMIVAPDGTRRGFLHEEDRATMPVERKNLYQTSLLKKLLGYHFGHRLKLHQSLYGWAGLRFLITTTNSTRVDNILATIRDNRDLFGETRGEHFWVTDKASRDAAPDVLLHEWKCADGTTKTMLAPATASRLTPVRHRPQQA